MKKFIKETLEQKFKAENTYFTMQDISVLQKIVPHKTEVQLGFDSVESRYYQIAIKDYEHIVYNMYFC